MKNYTQILNEFLQKNDFHGRPTYYQFEETFKDILKTEVKELHKQIENLL